jgi:hypothetical protein
MVVVAVECVRSISLNGNSAGDEAAALFADALRDNHTLQHLALCAADVTSRGAVALLNALQVGTETFSV